MIKIKAKGKYRDTKKKLEELSNIDFNSLLSKYGQKGVDALAASTPVDTGKTASSWSYSVSHDGQYYILCWENSHVENGYANIAVLLDVGHGTATGGYVSGRNYIHPAIQPIINELNVELWTEVTD